MPGWAQVVLAIASVVIATGVIWNKVLKPLARLITTLDKMIPLAEELVKQFSAAPEAFLTLAVIAKQFQADSGTSLRDVIDRLEARSKANAASAGVLTETLETARLLAKSDREKMSQLIDLLDNIDVKVDEAAIEAAVIAEDLEASHARADAQPADADPGAAADSASRSKPEDSEDKEA